jgi:hypothetical protein
MTEIIFYSISNIYHTWYGKFKINMTTTKVFQALKRLSFLEGSISSDENKTNVIDTSYCAALSITLIYCRNVALREVIAKIKVKTQVSHEINVKNLKNPFVKNLKEV